MDNQQSAADLILFIETKAFSAEDAWNKNQIEGELNHKDSLILFISNASLISEKAESQVGYIAVRVMLADNTVDVLRIAVIPEFRNKGFAGALLDRIENEGTQFMDVPVFLMLEVSSRNDSACHLYSKKGYEIIHKRKNYYQDESDALIMRKVLTGKAAKINE
jgi:[ribosomal protein S18]-alanine N-acetyltransferase